MKDIKFSRYYPLYHPRAGEETHFLEKIWTAVQKYKNEDQFSIEFLNFMRHEYIAKHTTIRAGHRWKKGEWFQPKAWTGLPYRSKPMPICKPCKIIGLQEFTITRDRIYRCTHLLSELEIRTIARMDGFENVEDFKAWFKVPAGQEFIGQRITFV